MAREPLPLLLAVAIERSYLDEVTATKVAAEVRRTGKAAERILLERGLLSERRVERLTLHVQYKTLRRADKAYAKLAMEGRAVDQATIDAALEIQRRRFEERRECLRLGAILMKQGKLTEASDRLIRAHVARISASSAGSGSAAATLMDDSASQGEKQADKAPSYEALDEAVARVEAVRKVQEDLSESVPQQVDRACRDSAAEFENACVMLARRRVQGGSAPVSKSGGIHKSGGLRIGA